MAYMLHSGGGVHFDRRGDMLVLAVHLVSAIGGSPFWRFTPFRA